MNARRAVAAGGQGEPPRRAGRGRARSAAGRRPSALLRAVEERDYLLAHVRCLLWRAVVREQGGRLEWRFSYANEDAAWRYFPLRDDGRLPDGTRSFASALRRSRVPEDRDRMRAFARERFHANQSYTQDYRVYAAPAGAAGEGGTAAAQEGPAARAGGSGAGPEPVLWLRERVEVRPLGPGRWEAIGATVDVTEQRLLEEERLGRERELAAARVRAMGEYFSVASHELRTPIATLKGRCQLLLRRFERGGLDAGAVAAALRTIDAQADRLTRLVEHLLDANRVELGRLRLERVPTAVDLLVRRCAGDAAARDPATPVRVAVSPRPPVEALVDPLRLEQVVVNLLDNALRHGAKRPVDVDVAAGRRPDGRGEPGEPGGPGERSGAGAGVRLAVRDRGPGIAPELREAVFEPFHQALPDSYVSGLGLGLFISRRIVELHGGWLRAEDPDDGEGGARFVAWLPATDPGFTPDAAGSGPPARPPEG